MIYNQTVTWTAFAILAMFYLKTCEKSLRRGLISPRSSPHSRHQRLKDQENEFLPTTTTNTALNLLPHLTSPQQKTKIGNDCFCNDDANDYSINVDVVDGTKIKLGQIWRRLISFIMMMMVIITLMMVTNVLWMMMMPKSKLGRIWSRLISSITSNCVCTTSQDHSLTSQLAPSLNSLNRSEMVTSIMFNRTSLLPSLTPVIIEIAISAKCFTDSLRSSEVYYYKSTIRTNRF